MGERTDAVRRWLAELARGAASLRHGFGFWRVRPGLMALGLFPALVVAVVFAALIVVLAINLGTIVEWLTPFAESWWEWARHAVRVVVAIALLAGSFVLSGLVFTALSLLLGEPIYARIWHAAEVHAGGAPEPRDLGFWRTAADSARLVALGAANGLAVWVLGLVPVIGVAAPFVGFLLASRFVALELVARPLESRGLGYSERVRMLRSRRARVLGLGMAVQLCFLVPGGQIAVMPAAVVAATRLAREASEATEATAASETA